jgi:hypothetical protein
MADDIRFKHPFTFIIGGPTGSGKSTFCIRFIQHLDTLCTEPECPRGIVWCYSEQSAVPHKPLKALKKWNVQIHEGVHANFENLNGLPCFFVLDDVLNEAYSRAVCDLFTKGSHHRNLSVILITQNFFHQAPNCRDILLNAKYLVALKNVRDRNQFAYLARQVLPEASTSLCESYREATQKTARISDFRFCPGYGDRLRYRTNVFPSEYPPVIYARINDEEDKIPLSPVTRTQDGKTSIT